jgi:hypothetical protein
LIQSDDSHFFAGEGSRWPRALFDQSTDTEEFGKMSADSNETRRRAEELFKKEQQWREGQQVMGEYQAELRAAREKTARLRALRLARDAANKKQASPAN